MSNTAESVKGNVFITGFWGWNNFKWICRELMKLGSNEPSYFSQKRINTFVAFYSGQMGMASILIYMMNRPEYLSMGEFLLWAATEFAIAGYALNQTQKEKMAKMGLDQEKTS